MPTMPRTGATRQEWRHYWALSLEEHRSARIAYEEAERAARERDMEYLAAAKPELFPADCAKDNTPVEQPVNREPAVPAFLKPILQSGDGFEWG